MKRKMKKYEYKNRYELQVMENSSRNPVIRSVELAYTNLKTLCNKIAHRSHSGRKRVYDTHSGTSITLETAISIGQECMDIDEFVTVGDVPQEFIAE